MFLILSIMNIYSLSSINFLFFQYTFGFEKLKFAYFLNLLNTLGHPLSVISTKSGNSRLIKN